MHKGHHRCAVQRWGGSPDGPGSRRRRNARRNGSAAALGGGAGGLVGTWLAKLLGDQRARRLQEQLDHGGLLLWVRTRGADATAQYQAVFGHLQQIGFTLVSEVSAATRAPIRISATQHEHTARYWVARREAASHKRVRAWFRLALHGTNPPPSGEVCRRHFRTGRSCSTAVRRIERREGNRQIVPLVSPHLQS